MLLVHNLINRDFPDFNNGVGNYLRNLLALINSVPFGVPVVLSPPLLTIHGVILRVNEYTVVQSDTVADILYSVNGVMHFNRLVMHCLDILRFAGAHRKSKQHYDSNKLLHSSACSRSLCMYSFMRVSISANLRFVYKVMPNIPPEYSRL